MIAAFAILLSFAISDHGDPIYAEGDVDPADGDGWNFATSTLTISGNIANANDLVLTDVQWNAVKTLVIENTVTAIADGTLKKGTEITDITAPYALKGSMSGIFDGTDFSKATITYKDGDYIHVIVGEGVTEIPKTWRANSTLKSIQLPSTAATWPTGIANTAAPFLNCTNLEEVRFNGSAITSIGFYAFYGCGSLKTINIPATVTVIDSFSFTNCKSLESLVLSDAVTTIGSNAFKGCTSLKDVYPASSSVKTGVILPDGVSLNAAVFSGCASIESVTVGSGSVDLSNVSEVFSGCTSLKTVQLPDTITAFGNRFFLDCTSLESIKLPSSFVYLKSEVFAGCTSLTTIDFNGAELEQYDTYGQNPFKGCSALQNTVVVNGDLLFAPLEEDGEYEVPAGVTRILSYSYENCTNMKSLTMTDAVKEIGTSAFSACTQLEEVIGLPEYVKIGANAFEGTSIKEFIILNYTLYYVPDDVEEYTIPTTLRNIADSAFEGKTSLKKVVFEGNMSNLNLGKNIFKDCTALEEVILPEGLSFIYEGMFWGCTSLKNVVLSDDITNIYVNAFRETGIESLVIPASVSTIETGAFRECKSLKSVVFESPEVNFTYTMGGMSYASDNIFAYCTALESVTFPSTWKTLPNYMFEGCTSLETVVWPEDLEVIGNSTFGYTGLKEIILPEGVYSIGSNAFQNCTKVEKVVLPSTIMYSKSGNMVPVGTNAFRSIGVDTENGAHVTIRGSPNFPVNANNSGGTNQFYAAKIGDLVIEACPVFSNGTFNMATIDRIIVSGGSSFNLSSQLFGIKDMLDSDGYLTVYVKDGDGYVEGKMMSWDKMGNVEYNKAGAVIDIPADVIAIPVVGQSFQRLKYLGFNVHEDNPYFTVKDGVLYFELNNTNDDVFEDARLVYMVRNHADPADAVKNFVVPDGVTTIGSQSLRGYEYIYMDTLTLPSSVKTVDVNAISSVYAIIIESEDSLPLLNMGNSAVGVFVKPSMSGNVIDSFVSVPYYGSASAITVMGTYTVMDDATFIVNAPLDSMDVTFTKLDSGDYVMRFIVRDDYSRSEVTVKEGFTGQATGLEPEEDGSYVFEAFTGAKGLLFSGLQINHYGIACEADDSFDISYSVINESSVKVQTEVVFTVTVAPGYRVSDSGLVVKINGEECEMEYKNGRFYGMVTILEDIEITVEGITAVGTYNVVFDSNGGSDIASQQVVGGYNASYPENPVKEGSQFFGWYLDGALFDFSTPVTSDIILDASWISVDAKEYTLTYESNNGSILAISENDGTVLSNGDSVPAGTTVLMVFTPSGGYEVRSWAVNGDSTSTISTTLTLVMDKDTKVVVDTEYTISSFPYLEYEIDAPTSEDAAKMIWKVIGDSGYNGMVYTPSLLGDYVYSCSGNEIFKIDLATGKIVKRVQTGASAPSYYSFTTVGNGYILVGYAGQVFDSDLNPVFKLHIGSADDDKGAIRESKVFYNEGYYYVFTETNAYKFSATDSVAGTNNIQYPVATGDTAYTHYISWYQGQSNLVFTDEFILGIEYDGFRDENRYLVTYDIDTLEIIDSYRFESIEKANLNTGYISYYNGIAYFNTYSPNAGLFSSTSEPWFSISSIEIDSDGTFNPATVQYYNLGTPSYPSSLIVVGDYGYINAGPSFRVIDMKTMTTVKSLISTMSHGNMTVTVNGDIVRAYLIPYSGASSIYIFEHDQKAGTLKDVSLKNIVDVSEYSSQIAHFGPRGEILFYNDSGYLFCVAPVYTASFVTNGGEAVLNMSFDISTNSDLPIPVREGYKFVGWYDNEDLTGEPIFTIEPGTYGDRTYYARYVISDTSKLVGSVDVNAFVNGGESVIISVTPGEDVDDKTLLITYSAYVESAEGTFLYPFFTSYVEMEKDVNTVVFTPEAGHNVYSVAVSCIIENEGAIYATPVVKSVAPVVFADVDLNIAEDVVLYLDGIIVADGQTLRFGHYVIDVEGPADAYTVNGMPVDGESQLFYYGQELFIEAIEA